MASRPATYLGCMLLCATLPALLVGYSLQLQPPRKETYGSRCPITACIRMMAKRDIESCTDYAAKTEECLRKLSDEDTCACAENEQRKRHRYIQNAGLLGDEACPVYPSCRYQDMMDCYRLAGPAIYQGERENIIPAISCLAEWKGSPVACMQSEAGFAVRREDVNTDIVWKLRFGHLLQSIQKEGCDIRNFWAKFDECDYFDEYSLRVKDVRFTSIEDAVRAGFKCMLQSPVGSQGCDDYPLLFVKSWKWVFLTAARRKDAINRAVEASMAVCSSQGD